MISLLILSASLSAQDTTETGTLRLSLEGAIDMALKNNRDVQLAVQDMLKADQQIKEAYSGAYPEINFTGSYQRNLKSPVMFLPANTVINPTPGVKSMSIGSDNSYNFGLSLNQQLYNRKVNTGIKIADDYAKYSRYNAKITENDVIYRVKSAFYLILLSKKMAEVSQQAYELAKANLENVSAMSLQGRVSEYDLLRSQVQLANSEPALIEARNNLEMAGNSLKNILAIPIGKKIECNGELSMTDLPKEAPDSVNEIIKSGNPLIQSLKIQEALQAKNYLVEKSEYYPKVSLSLAYNWQSQDNTFRFSNYNWANSIVAGLTLNYSIFDGFKRGSRMQQTLIDQEKLRITRQKTEEGLEIQSTEARLKMQEAVNRARAQEKSLQQAEKAVKIAGVRFKNGIGTQLEIMDSQTALTRSRTNYAKALYDFSEARAEWESLLSQGLKDHK